LFGGFDDRGRAIEIRSAIALPAAADGDRGGGVEDDVDPFRRRNK
jgi:hypothetical protein